MRSNGLRVRFAALQSALIMDVNVPEGQDGGLADKIIRVIYSDHSIIVSGIAETLRVSKRTVEREMKKLRESGRIVHKESNRYGYWDVNS